MQPIPSSRKYEHRSGRCFAHFPTREAYDQFRFSQIAFQLLEKKIQYGFTPNGGVDALIQFGDRTYFSRLEDTIFQKREGEPRYLVKAGYDWNTHVKQIGTLYPYTEDDYGPRNKGKTDMQIIGEVGRWKDHENSSKCNPQRKAKDSEEDMNCIKKLKKHANEGLLIDFLAHSIF